MNNPEPTTKGMSYEERLRCYERQKKTARLVCTTPEDYEAMVKHLARIWEV